jgi:hypothetical protein
MKISWKIKCGYFGEGSWELAEEKFGQVHINNSTEKLFRQKSLEYWNTSLIKFHKRLFK